MSVAEVRPVLPPQSLARAHEEFRSTGTVTTGVRAVIAESWQRCVDGGLDPARPRPRVLDDDALGRRRAGHPLRGVLPTLERLLRVDDLSSRVIVAVTDADATLLWVAGDRGVRARAERMGFTAGACWSEDEAGTNAPGTALVLDRPVRVLAAEHLADAATGWSCAAVPVHDPVTGVAIGAVDLTGGDLITEPHVLTVVRVAVATVEAELALRAAPGPPPVRKSGAAPLTARTLRVLGRRAGLLRRPGGEQPLGLRHTEVLTLLAAAPAGLTGERLAGLLHERPVPAVTVRAGLSRLRTLVPDVPVRSQPYRVERLVTDAGQVARFLEQGKVRAALSAYVGPVLPRSTAPGVIELRDSLHAAVRAAVLRSNEAELVLAMARAEHSRLDVELWRAAGALLPTGAPERTEVVARIERADAELA